jgi:hypothetical protein
LGGVASSLSFGPRPLHFLIAVDMTPTAPEYIKNARLVVSAVLTKQVKAGDSFTLRRVCANVATIAEYEVTKKLTKGEAGRLAADVAKPCTGRGSAITSALKNVVTAKKTVYTLITDGGLTDDPLRASFSAVVRSIVNDPNTGAFFVSGLSSRALGASSIRDSFKASVGASNRVILSGAADLANSYALFDQLVKGARK